MTSTATASRTRSADGTELGFERSGTGPALVLVDGAMCYREWGPLRRLAERLAADFTVFTYDRRGRGESGDTLPYSVEREVEDLGAIIDEAGGSADVYGVSSGAVLALHAAASGLEIRKLALFEPPIELDQTGESELTADLARIVAKGGRKEAIEHFQIAIGVPPEIVEQMDPQMLTTLAPLAHTLVYDCKVCDAATRALVSSVTTPTLVLDSEGSSDDLTGWAGAIAAALPNGAARSLAGQWHTVPDEDLVPVLAEFFRE